MKKLYEKYTKNIQKIERKIWRKKFLIKIVIEKFERKQ
jgi:hypothetical protein